MSQVTNWRKSTRSANANNCVEVGSTREVVAVRDTKARSFGTIEVDHVEWKTFIDSLK